jgi:hypothetical protein
VAYQDENGQEWLTIENRTSDGSIEVEEVEFDPTRRGYTQVPNYFSYYWTPLLGAKAALTYERICSFAHGKKDNCYPSIGLLADILAVDRHDLTGRMRRDSRPGRQQEYYQTGFLQQLVEAGLLRIETREHHGGRNHYKFVVVKSPPLLSPDQVAQLPPRLQRKHQDLLNDCQKEREDFARMAVSKKHRGGGGSTGGGMTPCQADRDAVSSDLNKQRTKKINSLSTDSPATLPAAEERVKTFYQQIGQPQVSRQKLQAGVKTIAELTSQGFNPVSIVWAMTWIATHQDLFGGKVHSLGLLPEVIGQALQAREIEEKRHAKHTQQSREDYQLQAEIKRRQELQHLYQTLTPTEQTALREVAVEGLLKNGFKKQFLLESLVQVEVCRLLSEGHKDSALSAALSL